ncbi:MAG: alpha/beta hydrolase [Myxococcales bacterium]|nr:alpha/beta hydrolase [Myxococcales bacterium]
MSPLAFDRIAAPEARPDRSVFLLHGILGSRRNWASFARRLAAARPRWQVITVDLRGHGDSHGQAPPHTVAACAQDLDRLATQLGQRPEVVIGHSFGGKVALGYAQAHGGGLSAAWSLDSPPGTRAGGDADHEIAAVIAGIRALPMPVAGRPQVTAHFKHLGFSDGLAGWMTTNVERGPDGLRWRFDLDVVEALLADYWQFDLWPLLERPSPRIALHLLAAGRSDRFSPQALAHAAAAPGVTLHRLPTAGHWVHIDDPDGLLAMLLPSFA